MSWKKRRLSTAILNPMDAESAKAKFAAVTEELGREIRVFNISPSSTTSDESPATSTSQNDEPDDFYDFTPEDYYRIMADKMGAQFLKTRKIRETEQAARRAKITKAVIRVRFPDSVVLEAKFHPSETIQCLMDLLAKVVARQDLPFYIYTVPPKQRVKDTAKDFYTAGFVPGAIVYFSYDLPKDADTAVASSGPFLRDDILALKDIDVNTVPEQSGIQPTEEAPEVTLETVVSEPKPTTAAKPAKPRWFKM